MITNEDLVSRLERWDLPHGPFTTVERVLEEMAQDARALDAEEAAALADHAVRMARAAHPRLRVLSMFLQEYAAHQPQAFAQALLSRLRADGPPLLVELLGSTGLPGTVGHAADILDMETASKDLRIAWAGALGDLGGTEAEAQLRQLEALPGLDEETRDEIWAARTRLEE